MTNGDTIEHFVPTSSTRLRHSESAPKEGEGEGDRELHQFYPIIFVFSRHEKLAQQNFNVTLVSYGIQLSCAVECLARDDLHAFSSTCDGFEADRSPRSQRSNGNEERFPIRTSSRPRVNDLSPSDSADTRYIQLTFN